MIRTAYFLASCLLLSGATILFAQAPPSTPSPAPPAPAAAPVPAVSSVDIASMGVKADGTTDDTAAIQKSLDAAGQQGGVVRLPAGKFLVAGSLKIPEGVANGQFVAFKGENPIQIIINATCSGSVRLQNCAFWGPAAKNVVSHSKSYVSLSNCYLSSGMPINPGKVLVEADNKRPFGSSVPTIAADPPRFRRCACVAPAVIVL